MGVPSIILAGGKSTRMGENKSTLVWKNKTWIEHIVEALNEAKFNASIPSDAKFGGKEVRDLATFI